MQMSSTISITGYRNAVTSKQFANKYDVTFSGPPHLQTISKHLKNVCILDDLDYLIVL